jgi:Flp pilus assembly protein TadD
MGLVRIGQALFLFLLGRPMLFAADLGRANLRRGSRALAAVVICWLAVSPPSTAQQELGSIIGRLRIERGDAPPQRILVDLEFRGASVDSSYTDSNGTFGFHNLPPNLYTVSITDDHYQPVQMSAVVEATSMSPITFVDVTLIPKKKKEPAPELPPEPSGSNLNMVDAREYSAHFPKSAVKEFKKGQRADSAGRRDAAIAHYRKAVAIAPDYYFARNNLGSDYLSKSDFPAARQQFQEVVKLNQSDAAAYFNLSNVCMLSGQLKEAGQYLEEGLRRQPNSALGQFLLGSLDMRLEKFPEAENALRRAIQLDSHMAQARLQLVNLLLEEGRKDEAASQLREFVRTFPDSPFNPQAKQLLQRLGAASNLPSSVPN